jgi:aspartate racemase
MGPLASAEFLSTLYRLQRVDRDQDAPSCILFSDPRLPDRTEGILRGDTDALAHALEDSLRRLLAAGADRIVLACVTAHVVLPSIPADLTSRVLSLLDVIANECRARPARRLILASSGTRAARLFEQHPLWPEINDSLVVPDSQDQDAVHACLYALKAGAAPGEQLDWLEALRARYEAEETLFACTELHLLHRAAEEAQRAPLRALDPLWIVARDLEAILDCEVPETVSR